MDKTGSDITKKEFTILVVEDDHTLLQLIINKLSHEGYTVNGAKNGTDAIEKIRENTPDLLLLDYLLTDMDGTRIVEFIKSKNVDIPFIMMTGFGDEKVAVNLMKMGARDYIVKDPNFLSLLPTVIEQVTESIITKRKLQEAEHALRESEYNYRILVESSRDFIYTTDTNGRFLFINNTFENITGYKKDDIIGRSFVEIIDADFMEIAQEKFVSGLTGKEIPLFQVNILGKNGKIIPVELNITILKDINNKRKGILGIGRDITGRMKVQETLRQNEEYFRALIENSSDPILILHANGSYKYCSNSIEHLIGYKPDELMGKKIFDIIMQEDMVEALNFFWEVVQNPTDDNTFEIRFMHKNGSFRFVEGVGQNLLQNPIVNGILINLRGLEDRKRLEEQLVNAQKMEAIGRLAGGMAHDFNNKMTAIINSAEILLKSGLAKGTEKWVKDIKSYAKETASLSTQLLAFSSKQMFMPKNLDINNIVEGAEARIESIIDGKDIHISYEHGTNLPQVSTDRSQIEQVIENIIKNSVEALSKVNEKRSKQLKIKTEYLFINEELSREFQDAYTGPFVCLSISDNGIGMDKETLKYVFEPFFTTKKDDKGAGLGLAVVYGIVKQHNGWIRILSSETAGTEFRIYLPVYNDRKYPAATIQTNLSDFKGKGERILLIEDEENVRTLTMESLKNHGYTVFHAAAAGEAAAIYEKENGDFDLVFTDVALPDKTGVEFVDEYVTDDNIGVVFTSGYFEEDSESATIIKGNYKFLPKPYELGTLLATIREILDERSAG